MIDRQYGSYYAICDACGTALDSEYNDFQDAVDGMRADGWKTANVGGEWVNYCPECAARLARPTANEFADVGSDVRTCGACGGRPVPENDTETRQKIMRYRQKYGGQGR